MAAAAAAMDGGRLQKPLAGSNIKRNAWPSRAEEAQAGGVSRQTGAQVSSSAASKQVAAHGEQLLIGRARNALSWSDRLPTPPRVESNAPTIGGSERASLAESRAHRSWRAGCSGGGVGVGVGAIASVGELLSEELGLRKSWLEFREKLSARKQQARRRQRGAPNFRLGGSLCKVGSVFRERKWQASGWLLGSGRRVQGGDILGRVGLVSGARGEFSQAGDGRQLRVELGERCMIDGRKGEGELVVKMGQLNWREDCRSHTSERLVAREAPAVSDGVSRLGGRGAGFSAMGSQALGDGYCSPVRGPGRQEAATRAPTLTATTTTTTTTNKPPLRARARSLAACAAAELGCCGRASSWAPDRNGTASLESGAELALCLATQSKQLASSCLGFERAPAGRLEGPPSGESWPASGGSFERDCSLGDERRAERVWVQLEGGRREEGEGLVEVESVGRELSCSNLASSALPRANVCGCHMCAASHWPARLKILGPVTTRRRCRRVEELKVIRSGRLLAAGQGQCARSPGAGCQLAATSSSSSSRSMSLTHELGCPSNLAAASTAAARLECGKQPPPRLLVASASPAAAESGQEAADSNGRTRCKANSISSCVTGSQQAIRLAHYTLQPRCLVCELAAHLSAGPAGSLGRPLGCQQLARESADKARRAEEAPGQVKEESAAREEATGTRTKKKRQSVDAPKKIDYLKPGDWLCAMPASKPKRRHSWICR